MKTPIGFLTIGSLITKGGSILMVAAIDEKEVAAVDRHGNEVEFDTAVLDLQDVAIAS